MSVIIPTFNRLEMLKESLQSVLDQTYRNLEVLVVDNGSTDDTIPYLKSLNDSRVRWLFEARRGAAVARNLGITESVGDILTFLDSDDLWLPNKLDLQLKKLSQSTEKNLVFCEFREFNQSDKSALLKPRHSTMSLSVITMMVRRADFLQVGLFEESLGSGEFMEWFSRARSNQFTCETLEEVLALRRVHLGNSANNARSAASYLQACKTMIDFKKIKNK